MQKKNNNIQQYGENIFTSASVEKDLQQLAGRRRKNLDLTLVYHSPPTIFLQSFLVRHVLFSIYSAGLFSIFNMLLPTETRTVCWGGKASSFRSFAQKPNIWHPPAETKIRQRERERNVFGYCNKTF